MKDYISSLDCTLRDGGYINQWTFGYDTIRNVISDLVAAYVDIIEVGFLRDCEYNKDVTCFNTIEEIKGILPKDKGKTKFSAMILYTDYDIDKLEVNDGSIDYLRVTFHNYDYQQGLIYCRKLQRKGYNIFVNPINILGYSDDELVNLIRDINELHPFGMSIVDTFGVMTRRDLMRVYTICENNLIDDIVLGLHLHDNLSMSFSLAQYFIEMKKPTRMCVVDGSLYGMGRKPGNLCLELIMDYLCDAYSKRYKLEYIFDAIENYIYPINKQNPWGYSIEYFLSAKNRVHRSYAEYYQKKGRLTTKAINVLLSSISGDFKGKFNNIYAEELYKKYIYRECIDDNCLYNSFAEMAKDKTIVLVAPGPSSVGIKNIITELGNRDSIIVIAANHYPLSVEPDFCFFSNMRRYEEYKGYFSRMKDVIITSNIEQDEICEDERRIYKLDLKKLAETEWGFSDSCGVLLVMFTERINPKRVVLCGFDGLSKNDFSYFKGHFGGFVNANQDNIDTLRVVVENISKNREVLIY